MKTQQHRHAVLTALHSAALAADSSAGTLDWDESKVAEGLDNDGLGEMFTNPASDHPAQPTGSARLDRILRNAGVAFAYGYAPANCEANMPELPPALAKTVKTADFIAFPNPDAFPAGMTGFRATLAHELVHWTGKAGRAGRSEPVEGMDFFDHMFGRVPPGYAREEMTAEMGSALLLDELGDDPRLDARARYVANWASTIRDTDARDHAYAVAQKDAEKAVAWLMQFDHD